jgi:beta-ribofuranosylaminobenzene 5'-phosphate synthase
MNVYVRAPARLHLGLIDLGGDLGRVFGGIGVAINHHSIILEAKTSKNFEIKGAKSDILRPMVELFLKKYNLKSEVAINVKQTIPEHVGLGSGTQLSLAVTTAVAKLFHISVSVEILAQEIGRGQVSGVGTALFESGGFVVEAGLRSQGNKPIQASENFPPVIFHQPFPQDWFFVVAIPEVKKGLSGHEEARAFEHLESMTKEKSCLVSHLILMGLLPALKEKDIGTFGKTLTQIQNILGDYFSTVQGSRFSSSPSGDCIKHMLENGAYGAGQSSWGPTVYGLAHGKVEAKKLAFTIKTFLQESVGGQVFFTAANNKGAYIKSTTS